MMDIGGILKDNIKVFLPVLGLAFVLIAFYTLDLDSYLFTDLTFNSTREKPSEISSPEMLLDRNMDYKAEVDTDFGKFTIDLFENTAPLNVNNFVYLSENNFYNGLSFHRVVKDFTIQTGDPKGDGYGNAGYYINDEISRNLKFVPYTVGMANEDRPNTNSSQFFITLEGGNYEHLGGKYTIIGIVVDGFSVVEKIGATRVDSNNVPKKKITVKTIEILKERK